MFQKRGVMLPEVMVASTIMVLVLIALVTFYMAAQVTWIEEDAQVTLQQNARLVMDIMARGEGGTGGIMEATAVTLPNASTVEFTSGIDNIERSFYLLGDDVMYDSNTAVAGGDVSVADSVAPGGLTFALNGNVVTINLAMQDQVMGKAFNVDLSTDVIFRN